MGVGQKLHRAWHAYRLRLRRGGRPVNMGLNNQDLDGERERRSHKEKQMMQGRPTRGSNMSALMPASASVVSVLHHPLPAWVIVSAAGN